MNPRRFHERDSHMSPQYDAYSLWETGQANSPKNVRIRRMRQVLPYVLVRWEGREILYNRLYEPLWERSADGVVTRSTERYRFKWVDEKYYTESGVKTTPWESADVLARCENVLREWGVPVEDYR